MAANHARSFLAVFSSLHLLNTTISAQNPTYYLRTEYNYVLLRERSECRDVAQAGFPNNYFGGLYSVGTILVPYAILLYCTYCT